MEMPLIGVIDPERSQVGHLRASASFTVCGLEYVDWDAVVVSEQVLLAYGMCQGCAERAYALAKAG